MATDDSCCTIVPYFSIHSGRHDDVRALCERFVAQSRTEPKCLYYGFSFDGDSVFCREGYEDADGVLAHLGNVGPLLTEMLMMADLARLEIHGPAPELDKLRAPLAAFTPQFFTLEFGFRRV